MSKQHDVTVNGETFRARSGQLVLDAALLAGVDLPHECRAGRCGSCLARLTRGVTLGGETLAPGMIHTCQARVFSDLELEFEPAPAVVRTSAQIMAIIQRTPGIAEVVLKPAKGFTVMPGQYCRFTFRGFPARCYSPTAALDGRRWDDCFHLHIKRVRNGRVSSEIGHRITPGQRVTIDGPFGHAFLRPACDNRLVLVASGTGFAPIWSIAHAAMLENPYREIVLIAGVSTLDQCYMISALELARGFPRTRIVVAVAEPQPDLPDLRSGPPSNHLPVLDASDIVYAAGAPTVVGEVAELARAANCRFHADPFEAAVDDAADNWLSRATNWLRAG